MLACGLIWFQPDLDSVLAEWRVGCRLLALPDGCLWLRFSEPRLHDCELGLALATVRVAGGATTCEDLKPDHGCLRWRWSGATQSLCWESLPSVSLTEWLPDPFGPVEEGRALRPAAARPRPPEQVKLDVRKAAGVGPAPPQQEALLSILRTPERPASPPSPLAGWWEAMRNRLPLPFQSENRRFVADMIRSFHEQRWDDALRRAIPLSDAASGAFQGLLGLRRSLTITPGGGNLPALAGSVGHYELLSRLYAEAGAALTRAGDVERAAFVFAELLNAPEQAVAVLERAGRYDLAAPLAETRKLAPDLQVRLYFQAGQRDDALRVARRWGCWAQVQLELDKGNHPQAREWRRAWAAELLAEGRPGGALELVWPQRDAFPEWSALLQEALRLDVPGLGGVLALTLDLEQPDEAAEEALRRLLRSDDHVADAQLHSLLTRLDEEPTERPPGLRRWGAPLVRLALARAGANRLTTSRDRLAAIAQASGDGWLRADLPPLPPCPPQPVWEARVETEPGQLMMLDGALLPDGRSLCALGEAGVLLLSRSGRRAALLPAPCHALVTCEEGGRVLLVARRGAQQTLSWLHPATLQVTPWCQTRYQFAFRHYDSQAWMVVSGNVLYAIDPASPTWRSRWEIPLSGKLLDFALGRTQLSLRLEDDRGGRVDTYNYPAGTLRTQTRLGGSSLWSLKPFGAVALGPSESGRGWTVEEQPLSFAAPGAPEVTHRPDLTLARLGEELWALLPAGKGRARFTFPGALEVRGRAQGEWLALWDSLGRYAVADLRRQQWLFCTRLTV